MSYLKRTGMATIPVLVLITLLTGCATSGVQSSAPAVLESQPAVETPLSTTAPTVAKQPAGYTVVDALGREVQFDQVPSRIVLAGRALFMVADAIYLFPEAGQRIIGLGQTNQGSGNFISLIDPDYEAKAVLDREAGAEQIAPLKPDAVILKSALAETLGSSLEALDIPVVYIDFETPDQYTRDLQILGTLLQDEARAAELTALYQERLEVVSQKLEGLDPADQPRTLLLYASNEDGSVAYNVPPMGWMQTRLVELAGGSPVWQEANPGGGWATVSLEQIAAWDPDTIFVVSYQSDPSEVTASMKNDPNWQVLRAVQEDRLYAFAYDLFSWDQPDPRWILGLQWAAGKLHPDRFADVDIVQETQRFYADFYGLDADFFEQNIRPLFKGDLP